VHGCSAGVAVICGRPRFTGKPLAAILLALLWTQRCGSVTSSEGGCDEHSHRSGSHRPQPTAAGGYHFENLPIGSYQSDGSSLGIPHRGTAGRSRPQQDRDTEHYYSHARYCWRDCRSPCRSNHSRHHNCPAQSTYNDRFSQDLGLTSAGGLGAGVLNLSLLSAGVAQS